MSTAVMATDIHLLGTPLKLQEGQTVEITVASNQPGYRDDNGLVVKYFARPVNCVWSDGIERSDEDSILIDLDDLKNADTVRYLHGGAGNPNSPGSNHLKRLHAVNSGVLTPEWDKLNQEMEAKFG